MMAPVSSLPNLFVVGAPKCGTTSLVHYLGQHPEVFVPDKKEPFFLASDFEHRNKIRTQAAYDALYDGAGAARYACDGSTFYLYSRLAAQTIRARCPQARILIMLRAPLTQITSMFQHNLRRGNEDQTDMAQALALQTARAAGRDLPATTKAADVLQYEAIADYAPQIRRFDAVFPAAQLHVEIFEEFVANTPAAMARILRFLDLDPAALPQGALDTASNVTATARRPRNHRLDRMIGTKTGPLGRIKALLPKSVRAGLRRGAQSLNTAGTGAGTVTLLDPDARAALAERLAPGIAALETDLGRDLDLWRAA